MVGPHDQRSIVTGKLLRVRGNQPSALKTRALSPHRALRANLGEA